MNIDLVLSLVSIEEVGHQVLGEVDSSDNDQRGLSGTSGELPVDLHKVLELDELTGVWTLRLVHGLDHGDVLGGGVSHPDRAIVGVAVQTHGVAGVLGVEVASIGAEVLRGRKGGGDESEQTEPIFMIYLKESIHFS